MKETFQPKRLASYLFVLAIAVVFTLQFGPGSRGCDAPLTTPTGTSAATVNGREIPAKQYRAMYQQQLQASRAQGIPEQLVRQLGKGQEILDYLVNKELLAQEA